VIFTISEFTAKPSRKKMHPNFQTLDYTCQRFLSKRAHAVAVICRQGGEENKTLTLLHKVKCALWLNIAESVQRVHRRYQTEFGVDPPSMPSIYAFYKRFCDTGCLCIEEFPSLQNVLIELQCQLDVHTAANRAHI
jgi:hypothetical protein